MASGSFSKSWTSYEPPYEMTVKWTSTANRTANTSTVKVDVSLYVPYKTSTSTRYDNTITINGVEYDFTAPALSNAGTYQLASVTSGAIAHNANGKKSITISVSYRFNATISGTFYGTQTATATVDLDTIAKQANITAAPNFNDEGNPTITYSNEVGNIVDSLEACISLTGAIDDVPYRAISKTGTSYTFNLTAAERKTLRAATTDSNSRTVRFYVKTVLDGETYLSYLSKTLTIVNGNPTLSPVIEDIDSGMLALTGNKNKYVRYYSNPKYTMNAAALKEATIKSVKATCGSVTRTSQTGEFYNIENDSITFSVTDSRGNTTSKVVPLDMIDYVKLSCNLAVTTPSTDGNSTLTISGNYFNGSFGATNNSLTVQYRFKENDGEYGDWIAATATITNDIYKATVNITGLNYLNTYTFQARCWDVVTIVESAEKKVKTIPVFDWGDEDFNFNVPVKLSNDTVLRRNIDNANIVLSANQASVFVRPNGTGSNEGQAIFDTSGNLSLSGNITANGYNFGFNNVLWSGAYYMTGEHTITLSKAISEQANGVILVFSRHSNGTAENSNFNFFFVPKYQVATHSSAGCCFSMNTINFGLVSAKYLYISDTTISGNDLNSATGTGTSGIKYDNSAYLLRYVIGI